MDSYITNSSCRGQGWRTIDNGFRILCDGDKWVHHLQSVSHNFLQLRRFHCFYLISCAETSKYSWIFQNIGSWGSVTCRTGRWCTGWYPTPLAHTPNTCMCSLFNCFNHCKKQSILCYHAAHSALLAANLVQQWQDRSKELKDSDVCGPGKDDFIFKKLGKQIMEQAKDATSYLGYG